MLSMALAGKIFADEAACLLRRAQSRALPAMPWRRVVDELSQAESLFTKRGWLRAPARYHHAPRAPRQVEATPARTRWTEYQHVCWDSGYAPARGEPGRERWLGYEPCRTMHAWVLRRQGPQRPWLVCIPGYGMGHPNIDLAAFEVGELQRSLDVNIAVPVLPLHGPRRIGWMSGDGYFAGDCMDTLHAQAQAVWDVRRLVAWLRADGARNIGVYGLSLGGYTAALVAAFEADLTCVIAGIPASDFVALARRHTLTHVQRLACETGLEWERVERVFRVISPLAMPSRVPWERRYIFGGTADRIVPLAQVRQLWRHWQRPRSCWYRGTHLSLFGETRVRQWLRQVLSTHLVDARATAAA